MIKCSTPVACYPQGLDRAKLIFSAEQKMQTNPSCSNKYL